MPGRRSYSRSPRRSTERSFERSPKRSRERSPRRSRSIDRFSRSLSRSPNHNSGLPRRSRSIDRFSRSRSRSPTPDEGNRVHISDLSSSCSKREIEDTFDKFGPIEEVWLAKNPPCFAFVVFKHAEDASDAVNEMNGQNICGGRVRVTIARPRTRGRRRGFDPNLRCYQCGDKGHFSRDCRGGSSRRRYDSGGGYRRGGGGYNNNYNRYDRGDRYDRGYRSRSRDRGYYRDRRSRSRSRSRGRRYDY